MAILPLLASRNRIRSSRTIARGHKLARTGPVSRFGKCACRLWWRAFRSHLPFRFAALGFLSFFVGFLELPFRCVVAESVRGFFFAQQKEARPGMDCAHSDTVMALLHLCAATSIIVADRSPRPEAATLEDRRPRSGSTPALNIWCNGVVRCLPALLPLRWVAGWIGRRCLVRDSTL